MATNVTALLPTAKRKYASGVLGTSYFPEAHEAASKRLFECSAKKVNKYGGKSRVTKAVFAIVPVLDNDYNHNALAVVVPEEDGAVRMESQVGWVPNRRCATLQPRIRSLMRATGGYVGAVARVTYFKDREAGGWDKSDGDFRIRIAQWELVQEHALAVARQVQPGVEQPWIEHLSGLTDLARSLYVEGRGRDEADLLAVTYEVRAGALVATVGNEVLTDMSSGGGDFFDLLRVRVEARGPRQG